MLLLRRVASSVAKRKFRNLSSHCRVPIGMGQRDLFTGASLVAASSVFAATAYAFTEEKEANVDIPGDGPDGVEVEEESAPLETKVYPRKKERNTVLSSRHRVALCAWPIRGARDANDARVKDMHALFEHVWNSGYDGVELSVNDFRNLYPEAFVGWSDMEVAQVLKDTAEDHGVSVLGALYLVLDGNEQIRPYDLDFNEDHFYDKMEKQLEADVAAGAEYVTYQICLPPQYMNTGGAYRGDTSYYDLTVGRLKHLTDIAHNLGINVYFETHIDRISEDPQAFYDIIQRSETLTGETLELNGDLSHYIYRGIEKGKAVDNILQRVNHMHQRMARTHGDLSVDVVNPAEDWDKKGVTYTAFTMSKKALAGGLSSRAIVGETGPMHLVTDTLTNDAKMVPLMRMMALYADGEMSDDEVKNPFI